jgi:hypothetical protein
MKYLLLLPLIVQAIVIFVDEFYFHFAPGQPRWERIGHPLDTVTVLAPVLWLLVSAPSERNLTIHRRSFHAAIQAYRSRRPAI